MDDLYDNAWGETSRPATQSSDFASPSVATWSTPKLAVPLDEDVELAPPSWSTGPDIHWNERTDDAQGFAWSGTDPDLAWGASTYAHAQTDSGYETADPPTVAEESELPTQMDEVTPVDDEIPAVTDDLSIHRSPSPPSARQDASQDDILSPDVRPPSPETDAFGTFETATFDTVSKHHNSDVVPDMDADAWGTPWVAEQETEDKSAPVDEWEIARRQKEKLDKKIVSEDHVEFH